MNVLVTYASAHGSTREIAAHVAAVIRRHGLTADCVDVAHVDGMRQFDAVVIGSAIHGQAWLPAAVQFVRDHAGDLAGMPVWVFSVGMPDALARPLRKWARQEGPKAVAALPPLPGLGGAALFTGVVAKEHLPWVSRVVFRLMGGRWGDHRDWVRIDAWAHEIAAVMTSPSSSASICTS